MQRIATQSVPISDELLKPAMKDVEHYFKKMYEEDPNKEFKLRISSIGRPLCQLQMEKAKTPSIGDEWNNPLRMLMGGVLEATMVCLMKAAGVNIEEEQTKVTLDLGFTKIDGTLDLVIDGKIWDVKSASSYTYKEKWGSYETLKTDDYFGYLSQLYGYSEARGLPPGGWIIIDKSSGHIKVVEVPENYESDKRDALALISKNVNALMNDTKFERCFKDIDETFKKRYTGNKVLESPCIFCKFRYSCWSDLQYLPSQLSTAYDKPYKHYTKLGERNLENENTERESEG